MYFDFFCYISHPGFDILASFLLNSSSPEGFLPQVVGMTEQAAPDTEQVELIAVC